MSARHLNKNRQKVPATGYRSTVAIVDATVRFEAGIEALYQRSTLERYITEAVREKNTRCQKEREKREMKEEK
jgi:hypothetical protein